VAHPSRGSPLLRCAGQATESGSFWPNWGPQKHFRAPGLSSVRLPRGTGRAAQRCFQASVPSSGPLLRCAGRVPPEALSGTRAVVGSLDSTRQEGQPRSAFERPCPRRVRCCAVRDRRPQKRFWAPGLPSVWLPRGTGRAAQKYFRAPVPSSGPLLRCAGQAPPEALSGARAAVGSLTLRDGQGRADQKPCPRRVRCGWEGWSRGTFGCPFCHGCRCRAGRKGSPEALLGACAAFGSVAPRDGKVGPGAPLGARCGCRCRGRSARTVCGRGCPCCRRFPPLHGGEGRGNGPETPAGTLSVFDVVAVTERLKSLKI